ncbi:F-box only protein 46-like, partial [Pyrgilauda ruficollis]|uniref:F-box only protein 46-like n=1 Tax=Pyrgilauda ruficollis TaxID=221976 RepID=UPI001B87A3C6
VPPVSPVSRRLSAGPGGPAAAPWWWRWPCHAALMEPNAFPQLQLWCPRPFGTFSQNKPCSPSSSSSAGTGTAPAAPRKAPGCRPSENTPPQPPEPGPAPPAAAEDGRVLLDTWYVIKPGNTKEKVAFFVAHQCGTTGTATGTAGRASTMKVKGNWGSDSSKAKRRRRCHHEPKPRGDAPKDPPKDPPGDAGAGAGPDLLSVAEMVALVERRAALALQSSAPAPLVLLEAPGGPECRRVAAAVAQARLRAEPPPPGQLFLLPGGRRHEEPAASAAASAGGEGAGDPALCRLYRHVSHDFLEIRFKIQRLLEPRQYMLLLPEHVMVKIFSYLPTQALAALKCSCHYFKSIIETFGVRAADSRWNRDPLYRDDPCKQCKKRYERGDVSLCRWHPKPYHHDLPYGRSYWMCCRRAEREAPGCRTGLHDNNWVHPAGRREEGR